MSWGQRSQEPLYRLRVGWNRGISLAPGIPEPGFMHFYFGRARVSQAAMMSQTQHGKPRADHQEPPCAALQLLSLGAINSLEHQSQSFAFAKSRQLEVTNLCTSSMGVAGQSRRGACASCRVRKPKSLNMCSNTDPDFWLGRAARDPASRGVCFELRTAMQDLKLLASLCQKSGSFDLPGVRNLCHPV
mmetsp:Transcript_1756/g.4232  ORF Transcript_1756/g.4232 Transcript_1756/m.4232 type:complete len:188 (-) Transcript_1756:107-670(-)